jgi:flagellar motor switch protein FliG
VSKIDGFQSALEALRALDPAAQERILGDILKTDPTMAHRLKSHLIQFNDLLRANPQGLLKLFSEIPDAKWVLALRGKPAEFIAALMKGLPTRKVELFKAAMAQMKPQSVTRIEATQREILTKALELESQGQLIFTKDNDPLV